MHNRHWENCLSLIRKEISDQQYQTWFKPIILLKITSSTITLQVPTKFFYEWLEDHYLKLLNNTVKKVLGKKTKIEYVVSEVKEEAKSVNTKRKIKIEEIKQTKFDNLNRNFKFKTFISGKCNSVARAAGKRICKNPGDNPFNPLMVYGGVGLGKTHLIQSIGNKISKKNQKSVYYVTSEKFANQFIDALKENRLKDFTKFYVNIDCLIIDDVQFFKGKEKTQEVFSTFLTS